MFVAHPVAVSVPATSANIGPGFDALGLALGVRDRLLAAVADDPGVTIQVTGEGAATIPRDASHLVVQAMAAGFAAMSVPMPGIVLRCDNAIPHGRGLGSSAAAIVGGLALARALVTDGAQPLDDQALLDAATGMEGHPDNVAAALHGGFTIAVLDSGINGATGDAVAHATVVRRTPHPDLAAIVAIPGTPVATALARGLLPPLIPHADAAFNLGRTALLVHALVEDPGLLMLATEDRLHQGLRESAYPESLHLVRTLRADGVPAVISGAGPTVLALVDRGAAEQWAARISEMVPAPWRVHAVDLDPQGVSVEPGC